MLKKILAGIGLFIAVICIIAAFKPSTFSVERKAVIDAPPAVVFAQVNDLHKWEAWSPWAKLDPNAKDTYEGPDSGKGASMGWDGNSDVGSGKMTIIESQPPSLIHINVEFYKPMAGTNLTEFTFTPQGPKTEVNWKMSGKNGFVGRLFCLFVNMDKMVGGQFEQGLNNLKTVSEAAAAKGKK